MDEQKKGKSAYDQEYIRKNIKRKLITFNVNKAEDREMLGWLNEIDNVVGYVKRLIREDMERYQ